MKTASKKTQGRSRSKSRAKRRVSGQPAGRRYKELIVNNTSEVNRALGKLTKHHKNQREAVEETILHAASRL